FERESERRSSALEPGNRAPHRRVLQTQDVDVQRLRRSGREHVQRHGLEEVLLMRRRWIIVVKVLVWALCLSPESWLAWKATHDLLGANPLSEITLSTGHWTLYLLLTTLAISPLRKITRQNWLIRFRRLVGLFAFFYGCLHLMTYLWFDKFFDV